MRVIYFISNKSLRSAQTIKGLTVAFLLFFPSIASALSEAEVDSIKMIVRQEMEVGQTEGKTKSSTPDDYRFRVGGYGEVLARFMNYSRNRFSGMMTGTEHERRAEISIPRFIVATDYNFNKTWSVSSEIEFEAGGTGSAIELENSENGEYETEIEKGGEVALEQFHFDANVHRSLRVRVGHLILPVGLTNAHHEPINFFGTSRPEGETTLLPSTWHETGLEIHGEFGANRAKFAYEAIVSAGLNANGFDRDSWVANGKQGLFETDNFRSPAYTARMEYVGLPGLRIGGSLYYCHDVTKNADKPQTYSSLTRNASVTILSADGQYKCRILTARFCLLHGNLEQSDAISRRNVKLSNKSPYSRLSPVAKNAVSIGGEVGLNIRGLGNPDKGPALFPYLRYEYYNPQYKGEETQTMDNRCEVGLWQVGLNWFILPNLVAKASYTWREIGGGKYNNENEFALAMAYIGWWCKK